VCAGRDAAPRRPSTCWKVRSRDVAEGLRACRSFPPEASRRGACATRSFQKSGTGRIGDGQREASRVNDDSFMKIYSTPCSSGPDAAHHADERLRQLYAISSPRIHELVATPEEADYILISNLPLDVDQRALRQHPLFPRYLHKSFALWDAWNTPRLLPGVYVNATRPNLLGRFRTGSYALLHPDFKNPFTESPETKPLFDRDPDLLFSFLGRNCHPCRDAIFKATYARRDVLIEDTSHFNAFTHSNDGKEQDQRRYYEICRRSKFLLCPRGVGASSIRLFEALRLGIAPIIISDAWLPCAGPDWKRCAIVIKERDATRLEQIVSEHEPRWREMGAAARAIHDEFFAEAVYFNFLISSINAIEARRVVPERMISWTWAATIAWHKIQARLATIPRGQRLAFLRRKTLGGGRKKAPATTAAGAKG